jgi:chromosomal replication initiator protein
MKKADTKTINTTSSAKAEFRFDSFIECKSNKTALYCAKKIAQNPLSKSFNPLLIYGDSATGKTHLTHAIWNEIHQFHPAVNVIYITAFSLYFHYIESIKNNNHNELIASFLDTDILIVEDLHHLDNKEKTQECLLHILEMLSGKQIIATSKLKLNEFSSLNSQLSSLISGVIVTMTGYDSESKFEILKHKALLNQLTIPEEAIKELAEIEELDIRQSEGALISLALNALVAKEEVVQNTVNAFCRKFYNLSKKD